MNNSSRESLAVEWKGVRVKDVIPLDRFGTFSIGREGEIKLLNDPTVGRQHATFVRDANGSRIEDQTGGNGRLFVNKAAVSRQGQTSAQLTIGDMIRLGERFLIQYRGNHLLWVNDEGAPISATELIREVPDMNHPGRTKRILDHTYLRAGGGEFVGLLGPSGAGKTTLLKAISGLCPSDSGEILLDGINIREDASSLASLIGFVPQDDIVHSELTVERALYYSARLRLPRSISDAEIGRLVEQTCAQVGLEKLIYSRIKNPSGGGLSGGQRKRVSVAVELLSSPRILFLDEPTSGLDPATEAQLMRIFRQLSNRGMTIVCTTHVVENADLMDRLVVLVNGRTVFDGYAAQAREQYQVSQLTEMYEKLEVQAKLERESAPKEESKELGFFEGLIAKADRLAARVKAAFNNDLPMLVSQGASRAANFSKSLKSAGNLSSGLFKQIMVRIPPMRTLLRRRLEILLTDTKNVALLALQPLVVGLIVGWVVPEISVQLFFIHLTVFWLACNNSAQEIIKEIGIYRRERFVGLSINSYLSSKFIFGLIVTVIQAVIIYTCVYQLTENFEDYFTEEGPWLYLHGAGIVLTAAAGVSIGLVISSLSKTQEIALFAVPLILIPQILFSGGVVPLNKWQDDNKEIPILVARVMPGFSSQRIMDTSLLHDKNLSDYAPPVSNAANMTDYYFMQTFGNSYFNLRADFDLSPESDLETLKPAYQSIAILLLYTILGYIISAVALRVRERE